MKLRVTDGWHAMLPALVNPATGLQAGSAFDISGRADQPLALGEYPHQPLVAIGRGAFFGGDVMATRKVWIVWQGTPFGSQPESVHPTRELAERHVEKIHATGARPDWGIAFAVANLPTMNRGG